jgi:ABC-type sugar transport system substrate-binding protein
MDKLSVLVSLITEDNDYQREQAASAQTAAQKLGASVQITYADNDAVQQTQQILSFIQDPAKRPHAIVVEPVGTAMPQVARAAVSAGIAWGVMNSVADYMQQLRQHALVPVFSLLSDNEKVGQIQGQQIAATLGEEGCVLYVEGPGMGDVSKMRTKGMMATKPPGVTVKTLRGDWTQHSGHHAIQSWLSLSTSRDLHVGMIVCQNDDMAMGAHRAFEELSDLRARDAWLRLPITGCDGLPRTGQAWVGQGWLIATIITPPLAGDAMQLLVTALKTKSQPPERTLVAPRSFPALTDLQRVRTDAAPQTKSPAALR